MIKFEIIGLTHNLNGVHSYNQNSLLIGKSSGNLIIKELEPKSLISFTIKDQHLSIETTSSFYINDRKLKEKANLKKNDLLSFQNGVIKIKIIDFSFTNEMKLKDHVNLKLDQIMNNNPEFIKILTSMKQ